MHDFIYLRDIFVKQCDLTILDSDHPFYANNNLFIYTHSCPADEIAYFKIPKVDIEIWLDSLETFSKLLKPPL